MKKMVRWFSIKTFFFGPFTIQFLSDKFSADEDNFVSFGNDEVDDVISERCNDNLDGYSNSSESISFSDNDKDPVVRFRMPIDKLRFCEENEEKLIITDGL